MTRLALFDIDCTLIDAHGAGGRAIFAAIQETYGATGALDGYTFHGRTDPAIVRDLAGRWGVPPAAIEEGVEECLGATSTLPDGGGARRATSRCCRGCASSSPPSPPIAASSSAC